jgi:hypothetical protein
MVLFTEFTTKWGKSMVRMESTRERKRIDTTSTTVAAIRDNSEGGLLEKMI